MVVVELDTARKVEIKFFELFKRLDKREDDLEFWVWFSATTNPKAEEFEIWERSKDGEEFLEECLKLFWG